MLEWAKREIEIACKRERGDKDPINRYFDYTDDSKEITKEEYQEREKRFVNQGHEKFKII